MLSGKCFSSGERNGEVEKWSVPWKVVIVIE